MTTQAKQAAQAEQLLENFLNASPHALFDEWFRAAGAFEGPDTSAMTLATIDAAGMPQARTVLLKEHRGGEFVFYTNSESRKGQALLANPRAALLFFWRAQRRQVLIEGSVRQLSQDDSAAYYSSRPRESRIGAWASAQSRPLASHAQLQAQMAEKTRAFEGRDDIPIPPYWRGFCLRPLRMEFWQEGKHRLHQRLAFTREETATAGAAGGVTTAGSAAAAGEVATAGAADAAGRVATAGAAGSHAAADGWRSMLLQP